MSLKDRQLEKIVDNIIEEELKAGRYPQLTLIQRRVQEMLRDRVLGLPRFRHTLVDHDELSDPDAFNESVLSIESDLQTAFEEVGDQTDRLFSVSNTYETEKQKMNLSLKEIDKRLDSLLKKIENGEENLVFHDIFDSFEKSQIEPVKEKGIAGTDAFIDLKNGRVLLDNISTAGAKYDLSQIDTAVELTKGEGVGKEISPFGYSLRDSINEAWRYVVTSEQSDMKQVVIGFDMGEEVEASRLSIILHSPKEIRVGLLISKDNESYREIGTQSSYDKMEWNFHERFRYFQLVMEKEEPDFTHGTSREYHFGLKNISLKRDVYVASGQFVSKPFYVEDKVVNRIMLDADHTIFPQTNIRYYIGIDSGEELIEWHEIESGKELNINALRKRVVFADSSLNIGSTPDQYGKETHREFGVPYYRIAKLIDPPEPKTCRVKIGSYSWKQETQPIALKEGESWGLENWKDTRRVSTAFIRIEDTMAGGKAKLAKGTLQRFTTWVYCDKEGAILNEPLEIGASEAKVYINNTVVKTTGEIGLYNYSYYFQPGWNEVKILTYSEEESPFLPNIDFRSVALSVDGVSQVFAEREEMKEVSLHDLYNNTSKRNHLAFAVDGDEIIINQNPFEMDPYEEGVRYQIEYEYAPEGASRNSHLRFMAILSRSENNQHVTPILKGYQITVK